MSTPQMPNIPGAAVMTDTLDFVKSLWGSMGVPGLASPTLSLDELDKKINDLKAVESWLNLNTAMLRSSIQALEVQRGTIATLKSMGQSLAETMQQKPPGRPDKSFFEANNPYAAAFFQHLDPAKGHARAPEPAAAKPAPMPAPPAAASQPAPAAPKADEGQPKPDLAAAAAAQMANPAIWWNLLQEQFKQAVSTAMTPEAKPAPAAAPNPAGDSQADEEAKPAAGAARKPPAKKAAPKKE
ncbi:hypothetical protein IP92_03724 [Pseudoduganella flava]|uniref:Transcriptional regulator n=1 Tax=Pseudoduganella flava TaxID=871742 RepID=A0A562PMS2_9BURK|nr:PhaM family polyhydroxyalkanoate granule multifunctional regulatory protein [Pseudoduganella flava]QGZ40967.1 hypothetical protein GO485_19095 [Pseudoduganella flava]TWI45346.1 hypothetical protein IP92_03724 [Pseudoduganella flava]